MLTATPLNTTGVLERIDELLEARYRSADLGNFTGILDETVFILLSRQTRDTVYRRVFRDLRVAYPSWESLLDADPIEVESLLRPSGCHRQRTTQLLQLLGHVDRANSMRQIGPYGEGAGDLTLEFLREMCDEDVEKFLCSLPGIGPKSARCVLAYSLDRPAFAVDTHVHRIVCRLGLVESNGRKADHDPFQDIVPAKMRKRLHMNLVHHGRAVCRTRRERCGDCPLVSFCERGRQALGDERPVAVDLFAGAGGLGLGFREAGFRIGLAVEPDRNAAQTYRFNHPGTPVIEARIGARTRATDLRALLPTGTEVNTVIAGPPCQGYSMSGRRRPEAPSNTLYRHVCRLARQLYTDYLVLENVPGIRSVRGQSFLQPIQSSIEAAGYSVQAHLLRASDFGVPQRRLRYFFLSRRRRRHLVSAPPAPAATHRPAGCNGSSDCPPEETPMVQDVLATIPALPTGIVAEPGYVDSDGTEYLNMSTMHHSDEVIKKIAQIKPGEGPISYRRLDSVEATTLIAGHRAMPVHPQLDRAISAREAALIQGFPLDYFFCGPRASHPLQIANAVPPPLAHAVAASLITTPATRNQRRPTSSRRG